MGCSYIIVFIAGATTKGFFFRSQHLATDVKRLSHKPFASLPRVFADRGAIKRRLLSFRNSICNTGSSLFYQAFHSSASFSTIKSGLDISSPAENSYSSFKVLYSGILRKWIEFGVGMRTTLKLFFNNIIAISFALIVATDPETP